MRKNFKIMTALALGMGLLTAGSVPATAAGTNAVQQQSKKDAIDEKATMPRPVSKRSNIHGAGDANPYKHQRKGTMNQRQLRKFLRQNPHQRSKYKK